MNNQDQLNETLQKIAKASDVSVRDNFSPNTGPLLQALIVLESLNSALQMEIYGEGGDTLLIVTEKKP